MRTRVLFACLVALLVLGERSFAADGSAVTFNKDVAPILFDHCAICHRPGGKGPMALLTYEGTKPFAKMIQKKVVAKEMPPWGADPKYGKFLNDPHLSDKEIATIVSWATNGTPQGNPKDLPPTPAVAQGWTIGTPDLILPMKEAFKLPAKGVIDMQYFELTEPFKEDRWVAAAEVLPGDSSVVHHSNIFVRKPGHEEHHSRADPLPGVVALPKEQNSEEWAEYKPTQIEIQNKMDRTRSEGGLPHFSPPGTAALVPKGSIIVLQVHYNPNGKETSDLSKVGLIFAKTPPEHELIEVPIHNTAFVIPPGAKGYVVTASNTFLKDVHLWSLYPHMHLRGISFDFKLTYPDGHSEIVLSVPKYDFYWQERYVLAKPIAIPKGSRLDCTAVFDNSADNPLNENPKATVRFGLQTSDEMMTGHIQITVDDLPAIRASAGGHSN